MIPEDVVVRAEYAPISWCPSCGDAGADRQPFSDCEERVCSECYSMLCGALLFMWSQQLDAMDRAMEPRRKRFDRITEEYERRDAAKEEEMTNTETSNAPWCCHDDCGKKPAMFRVFGSAGPEDVTDACVAHVGEMLGTPGWWDGEENISWRVVYIGPKSDHGEKDCGGVLMSDETKTPVAWRTRKSSEVPWVYWSSKPLNADDSLIDIEPLYLGDERSTNPFMDASNESAARVRGLADRFAEPLAEREESAKRPPLDDFLLGVRIRAQLQSTKDRLDRLEERVSRLEPSETKDADPSPDIPDEPYGFDDVEGEGSDARIKEVSASIPISPEIARCLIGASGLPLSSPGPQTPGLANAYGPGGSLSDEAKRWKGSAEKTLPKLRAPSRMELLRGALRCPPVPVVVAFTATVMAAFLLGALFGWRLLP